ncbi:cadmium-induced protein AS8 [Lycium ferocissimum]|uniref:cadmium-induced protein AS8 n=1 Tax=Lycium ferocissimum TaxID=112874 RepID=UPI0028167FD6|nr:cadmium-induced protein AS8 [Lycium ferocissimum]XP_059287630.1 cadmium-induced protein AS8 [Lycium ferocissimum]
MIIKGMLRRYERWNPVHPTYGAFWGMGIGIGCGVGWGPGFGPEAIGYVGAGCGVGFSVGFSLLGIGIGLPANYIYTVPYNTFTATRNGAIEMARSTDIQSMRNIVEDNWCYLDSSISGLQERVIQTFSTLRGKESLRKAVDLSKKSSKMSFPDQCMHRLKQGINGLFRPLKGSKD